MPILFLGDGSDFARELAQKAAKKDEKDVYLISDPVEFRQLTHLFKGKFFLEKVIVLAREQQAVSKWETFLQHHHLYDFHLPIQWLTPRH